MSTENLYRGYGVALLLAGILFALFFLLHPGGGDPASAATVLASPYAAEHTLGVAAMALMLLGIFGLYVRHSAALGRLGGIAFLVAFLGTALLEGVVFFDAYFYPLIAVNAPQLLDANGPFNTPPGVLALALPGVMWEIGFILLAIAIWRAKIASRATCVFLIIGSLLVNLPPQPIGPAPLLLIAFGAMIFGIGLVWLGLALWGGGMGVRQTV